METPEELLEKEVQEFMATEGAGDNHSDPLMDEGELLTELSRETIGESWGFAYVTRARDGKSKRQKIPIQAVDLRAVMHAVETLPSEARSEILSRSEGLRSDTGNDDAWLQALAMICKGLRAPVVLKGQDNEIVWDAGKDAHNRDGYRLAGAMGALLDLGLNAFEIETVATAILRLNQDFSQIQATQAGNS